MAWCENEHCRKDGLRKADIEFDDTTRKVLCHGCYSLVHPGWLPPAEVVDLSDGSSTALTRPHVGFAFQFTDKDGLQAKVSYGGLQFAVMAPGDEIKRLFGF